MLTILSNPTIAIIALAWIAFLLYWVISAIGAKSKRRTKKWVWAMLMIVAVFGLLLLLRLAGIPKNINVILWPRNLPADICSDVVVVAGLFVVIWARRTLGANWSANVQIEADHELVQSGPYKYVRHPIYSGFLTMVLGTAIAYGQLLGVVILAVSFAGFFLKAMREESILTERFSEAYLRYKVRTKTLIPYIL